MVKFFTSTHNYDYPFPAVSLAYFLRYPNPYASHVLSSDVIERHFDAATQRLYTTRIHLKRSKLPAAVVKILPKALTRGAVGSDGEAQNFILETSVVDIRKGWMETETQNVRFTGVLSVLEKQRYSRGADHDHDHHQRDGALVVVANNNNHMNDPTQQGTTDVTTTAVFRSRFGQAMQRRLPGRTPGGDAAVSSSSEDDGEKKGFFASWSSAAVQRTIETAAMQKTRSALAKSRDGMNVVLERMRTGGLVGVLEGMRKDRALVMGVPESNIRLTGQ